MMKDCNLGYIVKGNMGLLMQIFQKELNMYDMQLVTSKCLNTAVLIMYMLLGSEAIAHTSFCDVHNVQKRYREMGNASNPELFRFKNELLSPSKTRVLYYIMITDGRVHHKTMDVYKEFPGHVCVIEKIPQSKKQPPKYFFYQSYITKYKLADHIKMNNRTLEYSFYEICEFVNNLEEFFHDGIWENQTSKFWEKFVHVDESRFNGCTFMGNVYFCYKSIPIQHCSIVLQKMLEEKHADLQKQDPKQETTQVRYSKNWGELPQSRDELIKNVSKLLTELKTQ